jgi:hypothetical protein
MERVSGRKKVRRRFSLKRVDKMREGSVWMIGWDDLARV